MADIEVNTKEARRNIMRLVDFLGGERPVLKMLERIERELRTERSNAGHAGRTGLWHYQRAHLHSWRA